MKKELTVIVLVFFAVYLTKIKLEEHGFCVSKFSHISKLYTEQELIDQAIAYKIKRIPSAIGWRGEGDGKDIKIIRYRTVEEFKEKNPNCCTLTRVLPEDPPEDYGYVKLIYLEYYENDILPPTKFRAFIPYNSCGEIPLED